jgi:hypothetical protein
LAGANADGHGAAPIYTAVSAEVASVALDDFERAL